MYYRVRVSRYLFHFVSLHSNLCPIYVCSARKKGHVSVVLYIHFYALLPTIRKAAHNIVHTSQICIHCKVLYRTRNSVNRYQTMLPLVSGAIGHDYVLSVNYFSVYR